MSNRREFLQLTLAASALPALAAQQNESVPSSLISASPCVRIDDLVVESSSPLAAAFQNEAARLGFAPHAIADDITDLWCQHLSASWKQAPATLAGITLSTSLFCLEQLARDSGMRVWFRAEHSALPNGKAVHTLSGASVLVDRAATLANDWACGFAGLLAALPSWTPDQSRRSVFSPANQLLDSAPMVSWIIAPRTVDQLSIAG